MLNSPSPVLIERDNLSLGWADVIHRILKPGGSEITPLTLSITGFDAQGRPHEDPEIRHALDVMLASSGLRDVENVAFTIFPQRYYDMVGHDRHELYDLYKSAFARIQTFNPRNNKRGSYFQRLIDLHGDGQGPNQLEWMIDQYWKHPSARRRSKFQATTFDPKRDHSAAAQLEFPCLQQVSFNFDGDEGLILNAFYATQQLINKGYGNYLGLSNLGAFVADQMKRRLVRLNVFVGIAKADKMRKSDDAVDELLQKIQVRLTQDQAEVA